MATAEVDNNYQAVDAEAGMIPHIPDAVDEDAAMKERVRLE